MLLIELSALGHLESSVQGHLIRTMIVVEILKKHLQTPTRPNLFHLFLLSKVNNIWGDVRNIHSLTAHSNYGVLMDFALMDIFRVPARQIHVRFIEFAMELCIGITHVFFFFFFFCLLMQVLHERKYSPFWRSPSLDYL